MSAQLQILATKLYEPNNLVPDLQSLLQLADFLETLKPNQFSNTSYRSVRSGMFSVKVPPHQKADVVGWAAHLEDESYVNSFKFEDGAINFSAYSESRFGLDVLSSDWEWCFSSKWKNVCDHPVTAANRLRFYVEHGVPKNWWKVITKAENPPFKLFTRHKPFGILIQ